MKCQSDLLSAFGNYQDLNSQLEYLIGELSDIARVCQREFRCKSSDVLLNISSRLGSTYWVTEAVCRSPVSRCWWDGTSFWCVIACTWVAFHSSRYCSSYRSFPLRPTGRVFTEKRTDCKGSQKSLPRRYEWVWRFSSPNGGKLHNKQPSARGRRSRFCRRTRV